MGFFGRTANRTLLSAAVSAAMLAILLAGCGEDAGENPSGGGGTGGGQGQDTVAVPDGEYAVTVFAGVGASGSGSYAPGAKVEINAGDAPSGHKFSNWTSESSGVIFLNANSAATSFTMPANAVKVTANFAAAPTYAVTVSSAGAGASGGGGYVDGAVVEIRAGTAPAGQRFKNWTTESAGVVFDDSTSATTTFTMPPNAVTVTANFTANTYAVAVTGGTGGGDYAPGAAVSITAGTPPPIYNEFKGWTSSNGDVVFANATSAATVFIMPSADVAVTAVFGLSDGREYRTTVIGGRTWMAENLNYATSSGSWCYENSADSCEKYGRLYDWETAVMVCPAGWKLPSYQDWDNLVTTVGDAAGKKLKATTGWNDNGNGTDDFGFSAISTNSGDNGFWWTATAMEDTGDGAIYRQMYSYSDHVGGANIDTSNRLSVRCIKE